MPTNLEIKAYVCDPDRLQALVERISDTPEQVIRQEDVFFFVPSGRLKLRLFGAGRGELIYYRRQDEAGPKTSNYLISETHDPDGLRELLTLAYGVRGVVRKRRRLFIAGQTRIHLDEVEGLGQFVELEFVMKEGQPQGEGLEALAEVIAQLGIAKADLIRGAYVDMLDDPALRRPR